ncbi:hypothetical protein A9762_20945 [Pandoraea sp. ISTKB]|nr:hypothetical protein A9762_20945 [Pandoraea sp. ISTKB]
MACDRLYSRSGVHRAGAGATSGRESSARHDNGENAFDVAGKRRVFFGSPFVLGIFLKIDAVDTWEIVRFV